MATRAAASSNLLQPADVNTAIADLMTHLNEHRRIRRLDATRRQLLKEVDRPALTSLPAEPYDYHVAVAAIVTACPIASPAPRSTHG